MCLNMIVVWYNVNPCESSGRCRYVIYREAKTIGTLFWLNIYQLSFYQDTKGYKVESL